MHQICRWLFEGNVSVFLNQNTDSPRNARFDNYFFWYSNYRFPVTKNLISHIIYCMQNFEPVLNIEYHIERSVNFFSLHQNLDSPNIPNYRNKFLSNSDSISVFRIKTHCFSPSSHQPIAFYLLKDIQKNSMPLNPASKPVLRVSHLRRIVELEVPSICFDHRKPYGPKWRNRVLPNLRLLLPIDSASKTQFSFLSTISLSKSILLVAFFLIQEESIFFSTFVDY